MCLSYSFGECSRIVEVVLLVMVAVLLGSTFSGVCQLALPSSALLHNDFYVTCCYQADMKFVHPAWATKHKTLNRKSGDYIAPQMFPYSSFFPTTTVMPNGTYMQQGDLGAMYRAVEGESYVVLNFFLVMTVVYIYIYIQ